MRREAIKKEKGKVGKRMYKEEVKKQERLMEIRSKKQRGRKEKKERVRI